MYFESRFPCWIIVWQHRLSLSPNRAPGNSVYPTRCLFKFKMCRNTIGQRRWWRGTGRSWTLLIVLAQIKELHEQFVSNLPKPNRSYHETVSTHTYCFQTATKKKARKEGGRTTAQCSSDGWALCRYLDNMVFESQQASSSSLQYNQLFLWSPKKWQWVHWCDPGLWGWWAGIGS